MNRTFWWVALWLGVFLAPAVLAQPTRLAIRSEVMGEERILLVRTPEGYARDEKRYPVLYLLDGAAQFEHTNSTLEFLARNGRMPEMIVVAIANTDRTRDMTPTRAAMKRDGAGDPVFLPTSGGADRFLDFIETELRQAIEARYRTQPYRILAGHSFGGLLAVHAFLRNPDSFQAFVAVSPTLEWDGELLCRRAERLFAERAEFRSTLFLTLAREAPETRAAFDRFRALLAKKKPRGLTWDSMVMEDEDHGTVVLRSHYHAFRKIFDGWQIPEEIARRGVADIEAHFRKLTARFGFPVLPPEALMNTVGYALLRDERREEAIQVFRANVDRYPASANVYDSLGEAYEKSGKLELACAQYRLAIEKARIVDDPNLAAFQAHLDRAEAALRKNAGRRPK